MEILAFLLALFLVHGFVLSFFVILEKRKPASTLAWILALIFVPFVGALAYFTFGRLKYHRRRKHRTRALTHFDKFREDYAQMKDREETELSPFFQASIAENQSVSMHADTVREPGISSNLTSSFLQTALQKITEKTIHAPTYRQNSLEILLDGKATFEAIFEAIEKATDHIHILYYIFRHDDIGTKFASLLEKKAAEGVKVRVLLDGIGSIQLAQDFFSPLIKKGGEFHFFEPLRFKIPLRRSQVNFRNHRKMVIVDGKVGFTGGINVGDEYLSRDQNVGFWRDSHLRIEGLGVHHLQHIFLEDWYYATNNLEQSPTFYPNIQACGKEVVQIIPSGPDFPDFSILHVFFVSVTTAKSKVWITTPYFIPDESMQVALITASQRGVDVRILVPRKSDQRVVYFAGRSYYSSLLAAGVKIYEYEKGMLHSKTMVVDSEYTSIGSANMDMRSFELNFELNVSIFSRDIAQQMEETFLQDISHAHVVSAYAHENRPLRQRFAEAGARLFSPLL